MLRPQRVTVSNCGRWRWTISTVWSRSSMTSSRATPSLLFQGSCQAGEGRLDAKDGVEGGAPAAPFAVERGHGTLRLRQRRAERLELNGGDVGRFRAEALPQGARGDHVAG